MDNKLGTSIKSGLGQGASSQTSGPISKLLDTAYDIANPKEDRDYGAKAKKYWEQHGTTPLGTNIRYTGNSASSKGSEWARAIEDAYNMSKNVADSGIYADSSTGKITIKATDVLKNSDWYKEKFAENGTFIQIARLYGENPDGDTAIKVKDKDGNEKEITVKDWLEDEINAFDEYARQYGTMIYPFKEKVKENSVSGIQMSDDDAITALMSSSKSRYKNSNDFAIPIPKGFEDRFNFRELPSFNEETGTVSAKDFYEWYQVRVGGGDYADSAKDKVDDIEQLTQALAYVISHALDDPEATEEDVHQMAKAISLTNTLAADKPETSAVIDAILFNESCQKSIKNKLTEASVNLWDFLEFIPTKIAEWTSLNTTSGKVLATVTLGTSVAWNLGSSAYVTETEMTKAAATDFGEFIAGIDNNPEEKASVNAFMAWGEMYGDLVSGKGTEAIEKWANATNTPMNEQAKDILAQVYSEAQQRRENITQWAVYGRYVGDFIGEIVKQVALTNVVGGAVGSAVSSIVAAPAAAATEEALAGMMKSVQFLEDGMALYVGTEATSSLALAFVRATQLTAQGLGWTANLMAQGLVDTVLNDSSTIERLLSNPDEEARHAAYDALSYNVEQNLFGEMVGVGFTATGRGVGFALKKTGLDMPITRVTSAIGAKKHTVLAKFADWMANGKGRTAKMFDKIFKASDSTSRWYANLHWEEAKALSEIAHAAKGAKSFAEANLATQKAIVNRMEFELARNNVTRGIMRRYAKIVDNEAISKQAKAYKDAYSDLLVYEGGAARKFGDVTVISQETSNYVVWTNKLDYYAMKESVLESQGKKLSINEQEYVNALKEKADAFEASHSAEHVAAAKNYLTKIREYETAWMAYATKDVDAGGLGLYDVETVNGWRDTGFWGDDGNLYVPSLALKNGEDSVTAAENGVKNWESAGEYKAKLSVDEYELKPGDIDANYADPNMVLYAQQVTAAKVTLARDWGDALIKNDAAAKEITVDGQAVTKSEVRTARSQIHNTVRNTINDYAKNGDIMNFEFSNAYKRSTKAGAKRAQKAYKRAAYSLEMNDINALKAAGVQMRNIPTPRTRAELDEFMNSLSKADREIVMESLGSDTLTIKHFNTARVHTDMQLRLQRSYLANNPEVLGGKPYQEYVDAIEKTELDARGALFLAENYNKFADIMSQNALKIIGQDDFNLMVNGMTKQLFDSSSNALADNKFLNNMLKYYEEQGVPSDVAKRYLIAQEYKRFFEGKGNSKELNDLIDSNLNSLKISGNLSTEMRLKIAEEIRLALKKNIESEWAASERALAEARGGDLIDSEEVFDYIYKQMSDFVDTTLKNPGVVQVLDKSGNFHFYQLSPTSAQLYLTRPDLSRYRKGLPGFFGKTNRLARASNVTLSLKSFVNQWFRDPMAAYIQGGLVRSMRTNAAEIGELMGPKVLEEVKFQMGEAGWKEVLTGQEKALGRQLTESEIYALARKNLGANVKGMAEEAVGKEGLETEYYREMGGGYREMMFGEYKERTSLAERALQNLEKHSLGNLRETYLRKAVYMNAYHDAVAKGLTGKEAASVAEFTMQNATTNFSRAFAWGNNFVGSIPFLGAAINGKASFWRLFEIDPVGISSRFMNGLVIPAMALTAQSLESVQDREVYKTIPEYEKENALVFVVDGEKMSIPIPQELSAFLAPFRQAVEKSKDANDHAWTELVANDILGTSAIDLKGLVNLDRNTLMGDPTLIDRLSDESAALISQLSPVVVKTIYMAATGVDPYTGAPIDTESTFIDEDGNTQIIDSKSNVFLSWISKKFKEVGIDVSGSTMHALFKSLAGNAATDLFDILSNLFGGEGTIEERLEDAAGTVVEQAMKPLSPSSSKDPGRLQFTEAVKSLEKERDALMNSKEFQSVASSLRNLDSSDANYETKKTNLQRQYREMIQNYQQKVFNMVEQYQQQYGKAYDRKMFASTINLLTFYKDYSDNMTIDEQNTNTAAYYAARNSALRTMNQYGFTSPNDLSIFGYIKTDEHGNAVAKATSPTAIMSLASDVWGQSDRNIANIEAALEKAELSRKEMFGDEYKKAKAAGKAAFKKYKSEWNKKVVKEIAPYIESVGVDVVVDDFTTRDMLDNIIFVDNPFKSKEYLEKIFGKESK